jgi:magnesium transporter
LRVITTCYRTPAGELVRDLPADDIRRAIQSGAGVLWVDLDDEPREAAEPLLAGIFGFHVLTIDDCYNALLDPPKVDDYGSYVFVIVHSVSYDGHRRKLNIAELDLYVGSNFVVSFHRQPVAAVDEVQQRAQHGNLVLDRGSDFLAHALMDVVVDEFQPVVEAIDEEVAAAEELVIARPRREVLQDVLRLKRTAQQLKRSILPQRDLVNRFARGEYPLIHDESLMYFRDIYDHTVRIDEMIETLRDLADSALNTYLSSVNNRTNDVMKTLAVVTVIFLPLTLIAGIYGTNFNNVPEYGWGFGYFAMLGIMLVIALGLVGWFRWRGWF